MWLLALVAFILLPALLQIPAAGPIFVLALLAFLAWAICHGGRRGRQSWLPASARGGAALELLCGFVTAPSTTQTNLTMATGDTLQLRATAPDKLVRLLAPWTDHQTAGILRVRSPRLHDNNQGIRLKSVASEVYPLWGLDCFQRLYQNDTLAADLSGSATGGDIETAILPIYYDDLQGAQARFISPEELLRRAVNYVSIENTISTGTGGGWSGSEAINAEFDPWKANTDYALIGYNVDTECAAVAWKGTDTSNYRVGGPGHETNKSVTRDWFMRLSEFMGIPLIPVFNSNNRAAIQIDAAQDENGADPLVNSIFVELSPAR